MISSRELENKRKSHRSVLGVVKAMKALSAANVRKGGTALEHTRRYREFVDRAASTTASLPGVNILQPEGRRTLVVSFGSQYGLCGALNERVLEEVFEVVRGLEQPGGIIYAGRRLADRAPALSIPAERIDAPGSVDGLQEMVGELLTTVYNKYKGGLFEELLFVYPSFVADSLTVMRHRALPPPFVPREEPAGPPMLYIPPSEVMEGVIEEYVYVQLYATALETVIAENESRMRSMDYAEKSIKKKIQELTNSYNYALQEEITGEILEVIGGYEAIRKRSD
jgi:F-type H+-transporting ATPase subunit gamma